MAVEIPQELANLGYVLWGEAYPGAVGHTHLAVAIRDAPTHRHYDPERIDLPLFVMEGSLSPVTLARRTVYRSPQQVAPGRIHLRDPVDKRVTFYSYGGTLYPEEQEDKTVYVVASDAPILTIEETWTDFATQLAFESEAWLARLEAQWGRSLAGFYRILARTEPLVLYLAVLRTIWREYSQDPVLRTEFPQFYWGLREERRKLERAGLWREDGPTVEDLLTPPRGHRPDVG